MILRKSLIHHHRLRHKILLLLRPAILRILHPTLVLLHYKLLLLRESKLTHALVCRAVCSLLGNLWLDLIHHRLYLCHHEGLLHHRLLIAELLLRNILLRHARHRSHAWLLLDGNCCLLHHWKLIHSRSNYRIISCIIIFRLDLFLISLSTNFHILE